MANKKNNNPVLFDLYDTEKLIEQTRVVYDGIIDMGGLPDSFKGVTVTDSDNNDLIEIHDGTPSKSEFKVDYTHGWLIVDPTIYQGKTLRLKFYSRGVELTPASRIYSVEEKSVLDGNGKINIEKTLQDYIDFIKAGCDFDTNMGLGDGGIPINIEPNETYKAILEKIYQWFIYYNDKEHGKADLVKGVVPTSQLPSYVDDIIEGTYVNETTFFPSNVSENVKTQEKGKIYLDIESGNSYRWTGSLYSCIDPKNINDKLDSIKRFAGQAVYNIDISKVGSGNNILYITVPDIKSYEDLEGKIIVINTLSYQCTWNTPQTIYVNVNGLGNKALKRPMPANYADYDTKQYYTDKYAKYEIGRYNSLLCTFTNNGFILCNPPVPTRATVGISDTSTDDTSYVTPKMVGYYVSGSSSNIEGINQTAEDALSATENLKEIISDDNGKIKVGKNATVDSSATNAAQIGSGTNSKSNTLQYQGYRAIDYDVDEGLYLADVGKLKTQLKTTVKSNAVDAINELFDKTDLSSFYNGFDNVRDAMMYISDEQESLLEKLSECMSTSYIDQSSVDFNTMLDNGIYRITSHTVQYTNAPSNFDTSQGATLFVQTLEDVYGDNPSNTSQILLTYPDISTFPMKIYCRVYEPIDKTWSTWIEYSDYITSKLVTDTSTSDKSTWSSNKISSVKTDLQTQIDNLNGVGLDEVFALLYGNNNTVISSNWDSLTINSGWSVNLDVAPDGNSSSLTINFAPVNNILSSILNGKEVECGNINLTKWETNYTLNTPYCYQITAQISISEGTWIDVVINEDGDTYSDYKSVINDGFIYMPIAVISGTNGSATCTLVNNNYIFDTDRHCYDLNNFAIEEKKHKEIEIALNELKESFKSNYSIVVSGNNAPTELKKISSFVCDGVNDEVEIQSAIDYLNKNGINGRVILTQGTYNIANYIVPINNIEICGISKNTVLNLTSDECGFCNSLPNNTNIDSLLIKNLTVNIIGENNTGINFCNSKNITISNVDFNIMNTGIDIFRFDTCDYLSLEHCSVSVNGSFETSMSILNSKGVNFLQNSIIDNSESIDTKTDVIFSSLSNSIISSNKLIGVNDVLTPNGINVMVTGADANIISNNIFNCTCFTCSNSILSSSSVFGNHYGKDCSVTLGINTVAGVTEVIQ